MLVTLTVRHTRVVQFKSYMTVVRFYHQNFRSHINCFILHLSRHASWRNSNGVTSTSRFILQSKLKLWKLPDPRGSRIMPLPVFQIYLELRVTLAFDLLIPQSWPLYIPWLLVPWLSGIERWSLTGELSLSCDRPIYSWRVITYVGKPSAVGQPTRPSLNLSNQMKSNQIKFITDAHSA